MAPTRIERGLADDVGSNIGGEVIGVSAAAEGAGAGVLEIDQPAADVAAMLPRPWGEVGLRARQAPWPQLRAVRLLMRFWYTADARALHLRRAEALAGGRRIGLTERGSFDIERRRKSQAAHRDALKRSDVISDRSKATATAWADALLELAEIRC
jgi:hypothetical protein